MGTSRSNIFKRHFGPVGWLVLPGAVLVGLMIAWVIMRFVGPLPWLGHAYQHDYPSRTEPLMWMTVDIDTVDPAGRDLLLLGQSDRKDQTQISQMMCHGASVKETLAVYVAQAALLPQGWLSQPGVDEPKQVQQARTWLGALATTPAIEQVLVRSRNHTPCEIHESWDLPEYEEMADYLLDEETTDISMYNGVAWSLAQAQLLKSATHAGLAQLTLAPGLNTPKEMTRSAMLLDLAGERIALATQRSSEGLLGLNGRVVMTLLPTDHAEHQAGKTSVENGAAPVIDVITEDALVVIIHEWFHALDLSLAPKTYRYGHVSQSWFDQRHRLFGVSDPQLDQALHGPLKTYFRMKAWHQAQAQEDNTPYWTSPAEAMAYAFEQWAYEDLRAEGCSTSPTDEPRHGGRPTRQEARCMALAWDPVWNGALNQLLGSP